MKKARKNGAGQLNLIAAMDYLGFEQNQKRRFLESHVYGPAPDIASTTMARDRWFWKHDLDEFITCRSTMSRKELQKHTQY